MESDTALMQGIKRGDSTAVAELYDRYLRYVWRYVQNKLPRDPDAAQDVVSETFLAAIRGIGGFDGSAGSVPAWLTGIARHKLADLHRRRQREVADLPAATLHSAAGPDPSVATDEAETRERVVHAMHQLADEDRLLLEWKYLHDLSVKEIAGRLGRTEKAIEAQLYRARSSFRELWSARNDWPSTRGD